MKRKERGASAKVKIKYTPREADQDGDGRRSRESCSGWFGSAIDRVGRPVRDRHVGEERCVE
jgi:hypothetical protein